MKKAIVKLAAGLLLAQNVLALETSNLAQDSARFESAVTRNELFINFDKDMVLTRKKDSDFAYKGFEQTLDIKNADGSQSQILVKCDLIHSTKEKSLNMGSKAKDGKWSITKIEKIGNSIQRWSLSRKKQKVDMTCVALEKNGEKTEIAAIKSSLIDRALSGNRSTIFARIQVASDLKSEQ